jgi:hypothetical protein
LLKYPILLLIAGLLLTGCQDNITSLGAQYFSDTIANKTSIRNDPGFIQFADTTRPFVTANGIDYALTDSTTLMIIGKVSVNNENLESWGFLQFPPMTADTVDSIVAVRLILKDQQFKYGDTTSSLSSMVNFQVYAVYNAVSDSTSSFPTLPSSAVLVGSIDSNFADTVDHALPILLNQNQNAVIPLLIESNNAFVIVPNNQNGTPMTNARGFGTIHSYGDANSVPQIEYFLKNGDSIFRTPTLDFHIVHDMSLPLSPKEFTLRGSAGNRERITLNLTRPADTAHLDALTTINNALLVLHLDPANSSHSNVSGDTIGPDIAELGLVDSGGHYDGNGYLDPTDPTKTTYRFQVRGILQNWLRNPSSNLGFELRSGYSARAFSANMPEVIGVEDNTLNRWTFFGPSCSDTTKRPYFILSYSKLK